LTSSSTLTFSNPQNGATYILVLRQGGAGGYTVTWPGDVAWTGASSPVMTSTADRYDVYTFIYAVGKYFGSYIQNFT
jgi:hypothetical protein